MYCIFIHSSVSGHLDCFHVLAVVTGAALKIVVHASFGIMVFSWICAQEWDCRDPMVALFLGKHFSETLLLLK